MSSFLSPGILYGCFELLEMIEGQEMSAPDVISFNKLGVVGASIALECAQRLELVQPGQAGALMLSMDGRRIVALESEEQKLRAAVLGYAKKFHPPWLQNARSGRRKFMKYAPTEVAQVLSDSLVAVGDSQTTVEFWDALAAIARSVNDASLSSIGRLGERLTYKYEADRTDAKPTWVALESNEDGYDILSRLSKNDAERLCIEVKASVRGLSGDFLITRNEWLTASTLSSYKMYLWDVSEKGPRLAALDFEDVRPHIPKNQGGGEWQTAAVRFSIFSEFFQSVAVE